MAWLGITMFLKSFGAGSRPGAEAIAGAPGIRTNWFSGVTTSLLNPRVGVFYMAMIPQFLPADAHLC